MHAKSARLWIVGDNKISTICNWHIEIYKQVEITSNADRPGDFKAALQLMSLSTSAE